MKCPHCENFLTDDDIRCPECNTVVARNGKHAKIRHANSSAVTRDSLIASIVLTVLSALCCASPFAMGTGITAIILSVAAKQELNGKDQDRGIRIAGYARIARIITAVLLCLSALFYLLGPWISDPPVRLLNTVLDRLFRFFHQLS